MRRVDGRIHAVAPLRTQVEFMEAGRQLVGSHILRGGIIAAAQCYSCATGKVTVEPVLKLRQLLCRHTSRKEAEQTEQQTADENSCFHNSQCLLGLFTSLHSHSNTQLARCIRLLRDAL